MSPALEFFASGEPRPASAADLEAELSLLWRSHAEDAESRHAVTRASALTLLVYVENEEEGRKVSNFIPEVTRQNPCRAVILVAEPEAKAPELKAWVSAHCHLGTGEQKQVCCEQVTLVARGEAVKELENSALSLTVSYLPVYLWWRADRFNLPGHFAQILRVANRVLVDSRRFAEPGADLQALARFLEQHSERVACTDLNWARITPWRELTAQCFDSAERRPWLDCLNEIQIEYASGAGAGAVPQGETSPLPSAQALLFTGWLASRLNWQPASQRSSEGQGRLFLFKSKQSEVRVHLVPCAESGKGPGVFIALEMKCEGASPARFSLRAAHDAGSVVTRAQIPGRPPVERTARLEIPTELELLNGELQFSCRDRVYESSVKVARHLCRM